MGSGSKFKHGLINSPEYHAWDNMKRRCLNKKHNLYHYYGGRGITVCNEWLKFENFFKDMGFKPTEQHELDRIDNDKGYFKENCRWVTRIHNCWNRGSRKGSTSDYKGVSLNRKTGKWIAQIKHNGKNLIIGYFEFEKDAAIAYNKKAKELRGDFTYLNKIKEETK